MSPHSDTLSWLSLKQQFTERHVATLRHVILTVSQSQSLFFLFNASCLDVNQLISILQSFGLNSTEDRVYDLPNPRRPRQSRRFLEYCIMKRTFKQSHHYQQNEQSPLIFAGLTQKKTHITLEIQILAWDRYKHVTRLSRLMGPLLISNDNTYIQKGLHIPHTSTITKWTTT